MEVYCTTANINTILHQTLVTETDNHSYTMQNKIHNRHTKSTQENVVSIQY